MEPNYDPIEKENHLPNFYFVGSMLIFAGIYIYSSFNLAKDEFPESHGSTLWMRQNLAGKP